MRAITASAIAFVGSGLLCSTPALASTITMTGHVPTICQVASSSPIDRTAGVQLATLAIFCNSAEGATVSATLVQGDAAGYVFAVDSNSLPVLPGESADILHMPTAFHGTAAVTMTPITTGTPTENPIVVFQILAE